MTPKRVFFTGLELDPASLVPRVHYGVIPLTWRRVRFPSNEVTQTINEWLTENIEGRWAIFSSYHSPSHQTIRSSKQVIIAFEFSHDAATFVLSDGPALFAPAASK